jgi:hypothetical protein
MTRQNNTKWETLLKFGLRYVGTVSLLATAFIAVPYTWMDAIHTWLGMGKLPSEPVVGYLARSTSAFYALLGGLLWVISFDLHKNFHILRYLGFAITCFGIMLLTIDYLEGMPLFWLLTEGPFVITMGIIMSFLNYKITSQKGTNGIA